MGKPDTIESIKQILRKNNYLTKVRKINTNSCEVIFPQKKDLIKPPRIYEMTKDPISGLYVRNAAQAAEFWSCPIHGLRLMVVCDIAKNLRDVGVPHELVDYVDENDNPITGITDIFEEPSSEDEKIAEGFLTTLIKEGLDDQFKSYSTFEEVARTHNISTGYRLLRSFFP